MGHCNYCNNVSAAGCPVCNPLAHVAGTAYGGDLSLEQYSLLWLRTRIRELEAGVERLKAKSRNLKESLEGAETDVNGLLDRAEAAEAEVERLNGLVTEIPTTIRRYEQRAEAAEARLRAMEDLPDEWCDESGTSVAEAKRQCAARLRAKLRGEK